MDDKLENINAAIAKYMNCKVEQSILLGSGANGEVYKCVLSQEPKIIAVKVTNYSELLINEKNNIDTINSKIDIKLPKIYFCHIADDEINYNILAMSYINGISADKVHWGLNFAKRKQFAKDVVNNLITLQSVQNDKYGAVNGEQFTNWIDYYKPFAKARLDYIIPLLQKGEFPKIVVDVLQIAYNNLDKILSDCGKPTLIHGDYWIPNILVDKNNLQFVGCVDPFNVMWAESEYEVFAMILYPQFGLYKQYKKCVKVSAMFDLKARVYSLFSEIYWYQQLGHGGLGFMTWVAKKLKKQLKKHCIL